MIRPALALSLAGLLGGCAGTASYSVEPFYEMNLGKMVCCRAVAENSKDISSLQFDLATEQNGTVTVHFSEAGVGATAPITAQGAVTSSVAGAISNTAITAAKFIK
jgi:hypothetical protein